MKDNEKSNLKTIMTPVCYVREAMVQYAGPRYKAEQLTAPERAARFCVKLLRGNAREQFISLFLDSGRKPLAYSLVAIGTADSCRVHPRDVFQPALLSGAHSIILAHNHPQDDDLTPSLSDVALTKRLVKASCVLGVPIIDHIIFNDQARYYSFQEHQHSALAKGNTHEHLTTYFG